MGNVTVRYVLDSRGVCYDLSHDIMMLYSIDGKD